MNEIKLPKLVGGYQIGGPLGIKIMFEKKPNLFHRLMMKWCLGIIWEDKGE